MSRRQSSKLSAGSTSRRNDSGTLVVLLLGIQGAGKGTVGQALHGDRDIAHISAGDLIREYARDCTHEAEGARDRIARGKGVSTNMSYGLLRQRIERLTEGTLVLDGYPRRSEEIPLLAEILRGEPDLALLLDVPPPIAVDRLLGREVCPECGAVYGPAVPPRNRASCDRCGGRLSRRADDTPPGIVERHRTWVAERRAITRHYASLGILQTVNAARSPDLVLAEVHARIRLSRN
jgi:adenylate kinase